MFSCVFCSTENVPVRNSDVDYRLLEAAKAGDLDTVKVRDAALPLLLGFLPETNCVITGAQGAPERGPRASAGLPRRPPSRCDPLSVRLQSLCTPQSVNCRDLEGRHSTPLHFAAGYNRVSVVEYLLHHGADVHAKDKGCAAALLGWGRRAAE